MDEAITAACTSYRRDPRRYTGGVPSEFGLHPFTGQPTDLGPVLPWGHARPGPARQNPDPWVPPRGARGERRDHGKDEGPGGRRRHLFRRPDGMSGGHRLADHEGTAGFFQAWHQRVNAFCQTMFDQQNCPAGLQKIGCTFGIWVGTREPVRHYREIAERAKPARGTAQCRRCIEKGLCFHADLTVSARGDHPWPAESAGITRDAVRETKDPL